MPQKPSQRDYKGREARYEAQPEQIANRVARNKARREALKAGIVHKGDGKQIDHKVSLANGGSTSKSNTRVLPASRNQGYPRNAKNKPVGKA